MPGGEIIKTDYVLVEFQQSLQKIAADEAGGPGDQPAPWGLRQVRAQLLIVRHRRHMRNPAWPMAVRSNADFTSINTPFAFNRDKSARRGIVRYFRCGTAATTASASAGNSSQGVSAKP